MKTLRQIIAELKERRNRNEEAIREIRKKIFTPGTPYMRVIDLEKQAINLQDKVDKIEIKDILKELETFDADIRKKYCSECEEGKKEFNHDFCVEIPECFVKEVFG